MKPNLVLIAQWITTLRSGEYLQGVGSLKQEEDGKIKHCCLGVACEIAGAKNHKSPFDYNSYIFEDSQLPTVHVAAAVHVASVPESVQNLFGFEMNSLIFSNETGIGDLAHFNDRGSSFEEISAMIEEKFLPQMRRS